MKWLIIVVYWIIFVELFLFIRSTERKKRNVWELKRKSNDDATIGIKIESLLERNIEMKTIIRLLSVFLILFFTGCQKGEVVEKTTKGTGLIGQWEWASTTGGFIAIRQTPKTLGYTYLVAFTKDSIYQVYDKSYQLVSSNPFTVFTGISIFTTKLHPMIKADNLLRSSYEIRNDSLFMSQEVCDGYDQVFIRY